MESANVQKNEREVLVARLGFTREKSRPNRSSGAGTELEV
jgi:hypothetical protein